METMSKCIKSWLITQWLGFWLEDLDLGLAWSDHGSMARSWLSGSEAWILNDLARDLSSLAQRLNSILAYEDRIKKLYPQFFFFFLLVHASFLFLSFCFLNFLILNFEIWIFFSSNIANKIKCMQRKINMTTIFFPLDSASFPHFIFNFRILKFKFFFFFFLNPLYKTNGLGHRSGSGRTMGQR